jgi:hypothetical protein
MYVRLWSGELVVVVDWELAVSGLASLVGVIYRLAGMCSGARRIMSLL